VGNSSGWRGLGTRVLACAVVTIALLAIRPESSLPVGETNKRNLCAPIVDHDVEQVAAQTTQSLTSFPVVVHYMKDARETGTMSVAEAFFPKEKLKKFFREDGEFNRVWWKQEEKVKFVLVGLETCRYKPFWSNPGPLPASVPVADAVMRQIGKDYNVVQYELSNESQPFRGLDLYVWPEIIGGIAGYARSSAAIRRPSLWLTRDCLVDPTPYCDSKFAHEVGHFFGLCHVCTLGPPREEKAPATCKQTCPSTVVAGKALPVCVKTEQALMADNAGTALKPCEVSFAVNNAMSVLAGAGH
jgi:hypothetical protein